VGDYQGKGEFSPSAFFYQNLGEAEYVVAVYMYMRLLGYASNRISIITTYNGQKHLIRDVLKGRTSFNPSFFGTPKVTTVDRFQGQQNDFILLSLVRTRAVGHLRDVRRLVVAMSRARFGLFVFCRKALFENCYELTNTFSKLIARPSKLQLVVGETLPTKRLLTDATKSLEVEDVAHMGQLIATMPVPKLPFLHQHIPKDKLHFPAEEPAEESAVVTEGETTSEIATDSAIELGIHPADMIE